MAKTTCPSCQSNFNLEGKLEIGTITKCSECKESLVIIWLFPLTMDFQQQNTFIRKQPKIKLNSKLH